MANRILALAGVIVLAWLGQARDEALPAKVDLGPRFHKIGLIARDQGARDTCSLFAITAAADFECHRDAAGPRTPLSEEFLTWAANEATGLKGDQAMFYEALHGLNTLGICSQALMPYEKAGDEARRPSAKALADARDRAGRWQVQWIKRWDVRHPLTDAQLLAIKQALAAGHPVACGLRWPKALRGAALLEVPAPADVFDGHSILVVGYEDDAKHKGGGVFHFRNSAGPRWGKNGHGTMSYAYVRAYANDALWLKFGPRGSEVPTTRFELESLPVVRRERCDVNRQAMTSWGGRMWSHGEQLFGRAQKGGSVEVSFAVARAGKYRVRVLATTAPDFAILRFALNGRATGADFDLYSGRVSPSGSLELGTHELSAGKHTLRITAVGKHPGSTAYCFGLDALDLMAVK